MAIQAIYKIQITNWKKYNSNRKKSYRCVMIDERFLDDAKIKSLTPVTRLLFLSCLLASSQSTEGQCEVSHESLWRQSGVKSQSVESQLAVLQSLQLLSYEKIEPLYKKNRKEEKRKEMNSQGGVSSQNRRKVVQLAPPSASPTGTNEVIGFYCDAWKRRYQSTDNPTILPAHAKQVKNFVQQVGKDKAIAMIEAYLRMPDTWFVTKRHDIPTFLNNTNAVTQFLNNGRIITKAELKNLDQKVQTQTLLEMIDRNEI